MYPYIAYIDIFYINIVYKYKYIYIYIYIYIREKIRKRQFFVEIFIFCISNFQMKFEYLRL